jgi:hypothetical protein
LGEGRGGDLRGGRAELGAGRIFPQPYGITGYCGLSIGGAAEIVLARRRGGLRKMDHGTTRS